MCQPLSSFPVDVCLRFEGEPGKGKMAARVLRAAAGLLPVALRPRLPTEAAYEWRRGYEGFECQRIRYLSDGLRVVGYIWKPQEMRGKKLPLIIFNRGGSREFGKLAPCWRFGFYHFLVNGFVVLGSQYRSNDGSEHACGTA